MGDYTTAIKLAQGKKAPSAIYFVNRANAYFEQAKYQECLEDCVEATRIDPKYAKAYWRLVQALSVLERYDGAIEILEKGQLNGAYSLDDPTSAFTKTYNQLKEDRE